MCAVDHYMHIVRVGMQLHRSAASIAVGLPALLTKTVTPPNSFSREDAKCLTDVLSVMFSLIKCSELEPASHRIAHNIWTLSMASNTDV